MKVLLLLGFVAFCAAQIPQPCQSPKQWEGRIFEEDRTRNESRYGKLSYDEEEQRSRFIEERREGSTTDYFDVLRLHKLKREYRLNLRTRQCNETSLNFDFIPFGVPPFARYVFEGTIGSASMANEHFVVQVFDGEFRDGTRFLTAVTFPDCVPVNYDSYSNRTGFISSDFFDITAGIRNSSVFDIPKECLTPPPF